MVSAEHDTNGDDDLFSPEDRAVIGKDDEADVVEESEQIEDKEPLLSIYNPQDVEAIKAVLEQNDIAYHIERGHALSGTAYMEPARLFVRRDQTEETHELIEELDLTYMSVSPDEGPLIYDDIDGDEYDE